MTLVGPRSHPVEDPRRFVSAIVAIPALTLAAPAVFISLPPPPIPPPPPATVRFCKVRDLQSVIGNEARAQMLNQSTGEFGHPTFNNGPGRLPDTVVACVGGGSNAIGMFSAFLDDVHPSKEAGKGHVKVSGQRFSPTQTMDHSRTRRATFRSRLFRATRSTRLTPTCLLFVRGTQIPFPLSDPMIPSRDPIP